MALRRTFLPGLAPALLVLVLTGAACDVSVGENGFSMDVAAGKAVDQWTRTYTVAPGGRLEISNTNGRISASAADAGAVEVTVERITKASSDAAAQELLKKIEIAETVSGDAVRLETKAPRQGFSRGGHEVRYTVKVPKGLTVTLETVNGGVRLENLEGRITASTTNGGVRGTGLAGAVKASTTNGGVQIEMASLTEDVELETTNGGIRLQLPREAKATVDARCTNGGVSVSGFELQGEVTRRRASGTINGGGPRISAETTNGGVRISAAGASATE
jgi:hypothetical protein